MSLDALKFCFKGFSYPRIFPKPLKAKPELKAHFTGLSSNQTLQLSESSYAVHYMLITKTDEIPIATISDAPKEVVLIHQKVSFSIYCSSVILTPLGSSVYNSSI